MITETAISTILTASITGAGLIVAIYALITPIRRMIFKDRVELLRKKKKEFNQIKEKLSSESSGKDFKRLKTLATGIKEIKAFPKYLGIGVLAVFLSYMFTALIAFVMLNPSNRDSTSEFSIVLMFTISTMGFLLVGMFTINDVSRAMKGEFEQIKKEKEEVEEVNIEVERLRKRIEETRTKIKKRLAKSE